MGERERIQIRAMFERQGLLNHLLVFNMISLENELLNEKERGLIEKERVRVMEEVFREAHVFDNWPPQLTEIEDIEATDKLSEILTDVLLDRGDHDLQDLIKALNQKAFPPEKKKLFKSLFIQMGVPEDQLRALKA